MTSPESRTSPVGDVAFQGDHATIRFSRRVGHPPEVVWSAITDPKQLQAWYMTRAVISTGAGARSTSSAARPTST